MKRVALVLVGGLLVLGGALSASAGRRHVDVTPVQKAEKCIRAAVSKEKLAVKEIKARKLGEEGIDPQVAIAFADLHCAEAATQAAGDAGDITPSTTKAVLAYLGRAVSQDDKALVNLEKGSRQKAARALSLADDYKSLALLALGKTIAPPPPPPPVSGTFTIVDGQPIFGAGSSSSNACETVTVTETGIDVMPTGTLNLTGPGGFNMTNTLTFAQSGNVFVSAPSIFLLTSFGTYTENANITVPGAAVPTQQQMAMWTIGSSNDKTTPPCPVP